VPGRRLLDSPDWSVGASRRLQRFSFDVVSGCLCKRHVGPHRCDRMFNAIAGGSGLYERCAPDRERKRATSTTWIFESLPASGSDPPAVGRAQAGLRLSFYTIAFRYACASSF
jgi:hypothetical protein